MDLIDKIKQGYNKAHQDKEKILDKLNEKLSHAGYYEKKCLKEEEFFVGIEYPIQIISRCLGKDYWHLDSLVKN